MFKNCLRVSVLSADGGTKSPNNREFMSISSSKSGTGILDGSGELRNALEAKWEMEG